MVRMMIKTQEKKNHRYSHHHHKEEHGSRNSRALLWPQMMLLNEKHKVGS